ncbi:MAG: hypothetical protein WBH31_06765 [Promethearchaeia archaeon]
MKSQKFQILGENINTPEEFIEDLCDRINEFYSIVMQEEDKKNQPAHLIGFLAAFKGRLNRAYEKL